MDIAYCYGQQTSLYLNVTNRCSNDCVFCVRRHRGGLGNGRLRGDEEPGLEQLMAAVEKHGGAESFEEIVWCGFGEPTFRLDLITAASPLFRRCGARVRLNTNGHACQIHGHDVVPEIVEAVDAVSVSINAPSRERYLELCRPCLEACTDEPTGSDSAELWEAMLELLTRVCESSDDVQASVVGSVLTRDEIDSCRALALARGCRRLRVR